MNDLEKYFKSNTNRLIHKWNHYFEVYDRHLSKYRGKEITILEIGVSQGGSLQMWKDYFGSKAKIYGVDIDPRCKQMEEENIKIFIGSQSDRKFLKDVISQIPKVDILIDDGGHTMIQQIVSYEELFDHVKEDGVYICEDLHTSYWIRFGGGYRRRGTFIEYSKNFIDYINAHHSKQKGLKVNDFTNSVHSIHYYDSMLVVKKRKMFKPTHEKTGNLSFEYEALKENSLGKIRRRTSTIFLYFINYILRFFRLKGFIWK
jgi:hypothetical protein